ncbi:DnaJ subfamily C member 9 [Orchesella cincta]|uniref:DnaJ subfamily C member 9 n=1 Tax=Orchesella cincta TaxID=48709 RepID=A0A1D2MNC1_ORCCI|nr:DnaJ subfamily C member 9 [Orchesella cincta]
MDVVKELFETEDLYEVLGIAKEKVADEKALRSAYMKAALKNHPDKAPAEERETFTKKFQIIQKIYELFKDEELRKIYEQTGTWPDDEKIELDVASFGRLDINAVLEFKKLYQGSEEERQDIKKYYEEGEGDIFYICDNVFFLNVLDDEEKVNSIVDSLIDSGELKRLTKGVKGAKARDQKLKKAKKEAAEAEKILEEKNIGGGMDDLQKMILAKQKSRGSFLDNLEKKYSAMEAGTKKKSGKPGKTKADSSDDGPSTKKLKSEGQGRITRSRNRK